ncbi:hypothetical protein F511_35664 [Dorcoceras hygrometricum]|uniref:Uncharacterized protein n=1 Tax=Dorcoceras hygrometricum TaxID=472368 RepID=A0A2Z7AEG5_9LAMI|nr:hypothetical protein F511_35664 [Dorcoceras hygrometricum]
MYAHRSCVNIDQITANSPRNTQLSSEPQGQIPLPAQGLQTTAIQIVNPPAHVQHSSNCATPRLTAQSCYTASSHQRHCLNSTSPNLEELRSARILSVSSGCSIQLSSPKTVCQASRSLPGSLRLIWSHISPHLKRFRPRNQTSKLTSTISLAKAKTAINSHLQKTTNRTGLQRKSQTAYSKAVTTETKRHYTRDLNTQPRNKKKNRTDHRTNTPEGNHQSTPPGYKQNSTKKKQDTRRNPYWWYNGVQGLVQLTPQSLAQRKDLARILLGWDTLNSSYCPGQSRLQSCLQSHPNAGKCTKNTCWALSNIGTLLNLVTWLTHHHRDSSRAYSKLLVSSKRPA